MVSSPPLLRPVGTSAPALHPTFPSLFYPDLQLNPPPARAHLLRTNVNQQPLRDCRLNLGVEKIDAFVQEARVVHPTHYAVFWALEATAKRLSGESAGGGGRRERVAQAAEAAWARCAF